MDIKKLSKITDAVISAEELSDISNMVSEHFPDCNIYTQYGPSISLPNGYFNHPFVKINCDDLSKHGNIINYLNDYADEIDMVAVDTTNSERVEVWLLYDTESENHLKKLLGLTPITDKRTEDAEVVAELMAKVESALDESAEAYESDPSEIIVDYDGDIDCIRVELPSFGAESIPDIKQTISNVLDGQFYLTESLTEEYPLFYICFDAETADTFNNE